MKKTNRVLILGASFAMLFAALSYGQLTERPSLAVSTGAKVAGGPFVVGVTSKTATVVWLVQSDEVGQCVFHDLRHDGPVNVMPGSRVAIHEEAIWSGTG